MAGSDVCSLATAAMLAVKEGREEDALESLASLIESDASSPLWPALRARLLAEKDPKQALADASLALGLAPGNAEALLARARALVATGAHGARDAANQAMKSSQLTPALRSEVEEFLERLPEGNLGNEAGSANICELATESMASWKAGDVAAAKAILVRLRALDAASPLWPSLLARACLQDGAVDEAAVVCEAALALNARNCELLLLRAKARLDLNEVAGARTDLIRVRSIGACGQVMQKELDEAIARIPEGLPPIEVPKFTTKPAVAQVQQAHTVVPAAASKQPDVKVSSEEQQTSKAYSKFVKAALNAEQKGDFLQARKHCEAALQLRPKAVEVVLCLARMEMRNGNVSAVNALLRKKHPTILKSHPDCIEALSILAAAEEKAGDWDAAAADLEAASKFAQRKAHDKVSLESLLGRLARAQWRSGETESARNIAQAVMESSGQTQREASEVACAILLERGDSATALAVMLRCLLAHRGDPSSANAELVCGVMRKCSVEELVHVLAPKGTDSIDAEQKSSISEVVAYVGLIMKERSEVLEACRLYRTAVILSPVHASLCLNLMHCYALRRSDLQSIAWGARYFSCLGTAPAKALLSALDGDDPAGDATFTPEQFASKGAFHDALAIAFALVKMLFLAYPYTPLDPDAPGGEPLWRPQLSNLRAEGALEAATIGVATKPDWEGGGTEGHLRTLRGLAAVVDRSRDGRDLHMTAVRNEHAYFACISDALRLLPPDPPAPSERPAGSIYVVGDSHVLSSAWQTVALPRGGDGDAAALARHVLVPCLVTGAKIWHLQEKSTFYTKFGLWERLASLPPGAPVVLLLGEIDCREGILKAVQKGRHASVEAALSAVADLYVSLLREVRRRLPRSPLFVHPVAHVLPETRFLTLPFNAILKQREVALAKINVKLLEFDSVFQDEPGAVATSNADELSKISLLEHLTLDGTHMSPAYVASHLEPALARVWNSPTKPA